MSDNGCNPSHNSRRDRNRPASTLTRSCRRWGQRRPTQTTEARWCPIFVAAPATGARPQIEPEPVIACTVSYPAKHSNFSRSPHAENRHICLSLLLGNLAAQSLLGGLVKPDHSSGIQ